MEGFELIATGLWSIVPPILALVLALITKEVYSSLTIGVFTGMIIYQFTLNGAGGEQLVASFTMVPQMMAEQIAGNGALLLFLALLGALTVVIATAGGSRAYAEWVTTHVKNARAASILTALLGIIIFVDDYFNCLTVGAVMRPVTDKFRVSHEKLAWRIPPEGSALEAVSLARIADKAQVDLEGAPNIPTVVTEEGDIDDAAAGAIEEYKGLNISERGTIWDLIVPILVLIVFSILGMMYMGGFFSGVDFATAVGENPVMGLCIGACVALVVAACMFLPRKLMNLGGFVEAMSEGVRSMIGAIMILVLAWSLGGCCRYLLGTGEFVSGFLNGLGVGLDLLPAVIFVVAAFIGFAMGTSWGTIALILPIIIGVFAADDPLFLVAVGAALAGAVYGDHISPISDTTILSSAGAKCNHLRHVATQIPYATLVMIVCFVGYIIAGFTKNPWISLALGVVLIVIAVLVLVRMEASKKAKA